MGEPGATAPHPVLVEAKPSIRSVVHSAVSRATNDDDDDDHHHHHHLHHPHATSSPPRQLTLEHGNGGGGDDDGGVAVAQSCPDMPSETVTEVEIDTEANLRRLQQALPAPAPAGGLHASWTRPAQWNAGSLQRPLPASGADVLRSSWKRPTQCDAGSVQQPLPASGPEALDDASRKRPAPCDAGSLQQPSRASGSDVLEASRRRPRQWNAGAEPEPALLRQPAVPTESRSSMSVMPVAAKGTRGRTKSSQFIPIASLLNPHTGLKRRRSRLDVDGPNTAALSSKKRRLQLNTATSLLSHPHSRPASYRIGGQPAAGVATRSSPRLDPTGRRRGRNASSFLRFSVLNQMRKRLGIKVPADLPSDAHPRPASSCLGDLVEPLWPPPRPESTLEPESVPLPWPAPSSRRFRTTEKAEHPSSVRTRRFASLLPRDQLTSLKRLLLPRPPPLHLPTVESNAPFRPLDQPHCRQPIKTYAEPCQESLPFPQRHDEPLGDLQEDSEQNRHKCAILFPFGRSRSACRGIFR
ncbi:hypothetical protein RJ55_07547 [Drechmeria coniospora]|nr:hypothetical protein RJ55_07547 [Drechmeria coniospora]